MSKEETKEENNKELSTSGVNLPSLSNDETCDVESSSSVTEEASETVEEEQEEIPTNTREEGYSAGTREEGYSLENDPLRIPGAFAVGGINLSLSFTSSEYSSQEGNAEVAERLDTSSIPQVTAQLVDEAAEEQQRLELERGRQELELERQRNQELESEIRQIRSDAVVAIPVNLEETDRHNPATSRELDRAGSNWFGSRNLKRWFAGGVVFLLMTAVVIGSVLGVVLGTAPTTGNISTWSQVGQTLDGEAAGDWIGFSVALSGNGTIVAGGAVGNNFNGQHAGQVRVFSYDTGSNRWNQLGQDLNGNEREDYFGYSVALSNDGNVMAAGAMTDPDRNGYVQVHAYNSTADQWGQIGQDLEGRAPGDWFGYSVAVSADGTIVAAGGPGRLSKEHDYSGNKTGYVRVSAFDDATSSWTRMGQDLNGSGIGDSFGGTVALSADGMVLAVGADWSNSNGQDAGRVQVFAFNSSIGHWEQMGEDLVGDTARVFFGFAVSLSGDGTILAVGAVWNSGTNGVGSGLVRVYSYDVVNSYWNQMGQDIHGESGDNNFGFSVALSADGMIMAAGANRNDGKGGAFSGHVRVFWYNSTADQWNQVGQDLDGEGADDRFGGSVALSSDGSIVAAGAHRNNDNGENSGHVRVFKAPETSD